MTEAASGLPPAVVLATAEGAGHAAMPDLTAFGIILAGIFFVPLLSRRARVPVVVGEILFGVLLGDSGLKLIGTTEWLSILAEFGLLFLMFIAGLEIDFRKILGRRKLDAFIALTIYALSFVLAVLAMQALGMSPFLGLIISATGVGVVIPVLRELGAGETRFGRLILLASLISEFITLLVVVVFDVFVTHGFSLRLLPIFGVAFFLILVLEVLRSLIWWFPERFRVLFAEDDPAEMGMRFSLFLLALFVVVSALAGLEPVVGAFLAGITLAALFPDRRILDHKFLAMGFGFLIPIFFIHVGLRFELPDITSWPVLSAFLLLLLLSYAVRAVAALPLLFVGFSPRETVAGGMLIATQLSLNIVAGEIALRLGLIDEPLYFSVVLLAIVTSSVFPTAAKRVLEARPGAPRGGIPVLDAHSGLE